ncbi:MAG: molybdopterin-guanine dinucleotide biosynthesis protein B [Salaquimonas sp.]
MNKNPLIFGVTGWKNSGKTRMVAALVSEFTSRGKKVSTIKHAHHSFDIDHENTDSWKHRKAGAGEVALVSRNRWALMHELVNEDEPDLTAIIHKLAPCDMIIIEGYKKEGHFKIELIREGASRDKPLWPDDPSIMALVSDTAVADCDLPIFSSNAISEIADFITSLNDLLIRKEDH